MKFPNFLMNKSFTARTLLLVAGLFLMSLTASAQNPGLEQCRNGGASSPQQCIGTAWVTGNANAVQAHYAETQFLPYRFSLTRASIGTMYTITIGYDIIKDNGGTAAHAIDYLGTFNNTESNADPCSDIVSGCVVTSPTDTINIPKDTSGATFSPFLGAQVPQPQGQFTIWGGTFHDASMNPLMVPTYNTYVSGDTHRNITIKFTATTSNVVIAWSGHVAWSGDWGAGNSAGGISGSPYHTNIDGCIGINGCGSLDVQLAAAAAAPAGLVRVIKVADVVSGVAITSFPFTTSSDFPPSNSFSLVDNNPDTSVNGGGVLKESAAITSFGASHSITINEENIAGWSLHDLSCVANFNGTVVSTSVPVQPSTKAGTAVVYVNPGGLVTCTFTNGQLRTTAAPVSVTGQVRASDGSPMAGISLRLTDVTSGEIKTATTDTSGNYTFDNLTSQDFFQLTVTAKRYRFQNATRSFSLNDNVVGVDFISSSY